MRCCTGQEMTRDARASAGSPVRTEPGVRACATLTVTVSNDTVRCAGGDVQDDVCSGKLLLRERQ